MIVTCFSVHLLFFNSWKNNLTDNSAVYLEEGESHFISIPNTYAERFYEATLLQTNATHGFRVVFYNLYLRYDDDEVQIGTGDDPSDIQSIIANLRGNAGNDQDDVYLDTNQMWFAAIRGRQKQSHQCGC